MAEGRGWEPAYASVRLYVVAAEATSSVARQLSAIQAAAGRPVGPRGIGLKIHMARSFTMPWVSDFGTWEAERVQVAKKAAAILFPKLNASEQFKACRNVQARSSSICIAICRGRGTASEIARGRRARDEVAALLCRMGYRTMRVDDDGIQQLLHEPVAVRASRGSAKEKNR